MKDPFPGSLQKCLTKMWPEKKTEVISLFSTSRAWFYRYRSKLKKKSKKGFEIAAPVLSEWENI